MLDEIVAIVVLEGVIPTFHSPCLPNECMPTSMLSAPFAINCRLPNFDDPIEEALWILRHEDKYVEAAVELLGGVCRWVAEVGEEYAVPTVRLREWLTLGVVHRVRTDAKVCHEYKTCVAVAPLFDELDQRGELDADRSDSTIETVSPEQFGRLILDLFSLRPVIIEVRELLLARESFDSSEDG